MVLYLFNTIVNVLYQKWTKVHDINLYFKIYFIISWIWGSSGEICIAGFVIKVSHLFFIICFVSSVLWNGKIGVEDQGVRGHQKFQYYKRKINLCKCRLLFNLRQRNKILLFNWFMGIWFRKNNLLKKKWSQKVSFKIRLIGRPFT